jgi:hypothetical protein
MVAGLLMNFNYEIPPETNSDSMQDIEHAFAYPKSGELKLKVSLQK